MDRIFKWFIAMAIAVYIGENLFMDIVFYRDLKWRASVVEEVAETMSAIEFRLCGEGGCPRP